jgi:hypothetical protein
LAAVALIVLVLHPESNIIVFHPPPRLKILEFGHLAVVLVGEEEIARDLALVEHEAPLLPVELDRQHLLPVFVVVQQSDDGNVVTAIFGLVRRTLKG